MKGRTGIGFPRLFLSRPAGTPAPGRAKLLPLLSPFILVGLCVLLFFRGIGSRELWASHEARAAQNAQRMLDDGEWLLPRLFDGQVELQKPPGFYWLVAVVGWIRGGVDGWAVRLPAAVAGTMTVLLVWWYLCRRGRPVAALVAGAILAGAVHFTGTARIGRIDVPLASVVTAMMLVARDALGRAPDSRAFAWSRLRPFVLVGALGAAALLLKGPIGLFLPAAALGALALVERVSVRRLPVLFVTVGLVSLAIAVPWFVWANAETGGEFFRVFFLYHHFNRAFGGAESLAGHPWWFYVPRFAADFLPWSPLLVAAVVLRRWRGDADARFGLMWFAIMVACLSLSRFKRADYLLPAYPGAAIFLGCVVEQWYSARSRLSRTRAAGAFALILLLLPIGWIVFDYRVTDREEASQEQAPFAHRVRETAPAPEPVILFRVESHLLAYHVGRPVHTLVEWGDLNSVLRTAGPHAVVTRAEFLDDCRRQLIVPFEVVARSEDVSRARPHRPLVLLRTVPEACPTPPKD
jgi:4-amino-4-deoxy-L-arabinose transferase-like glycosyltransferase